MKSHRSMLQFGMLLDVVEQIQSELVKSQVHDGNTGGHFLNIHDFFLQAFELCLAILQIVFFFIGEKIVIAGGGHVHNLHAGFDFRFQVDILVQSNIGPEIDKLNHLVFAANTVNTTEALNNADRIPMNIVIDKIVTILEVLTFGDTVGSNQNINIDLRNIIKQIPIL